jgi:hypothetical protein
MDIVGTDTAFWQVILSENTKNTRKIDDDSKLFHDDYN